MTYIGTLDVPSLVYLPHTHHFPRHLEFFFAVTLYNQYYIFSHHEVEVLVPKGTVAHAEIQGRDCQNHCLYQISKLEKAHDASCICKV